MRELVQEMKLYALESLWEDCVKETAWRLPSLDQSSNAFYELMEWETSKLVDYVLDTPIEKLMQEMKANSYIDMESMFPQYTSGNLGIEVPNSVYTSKACLLRWEFIDGLKNFKSE